MKGLHELPDRTILVDAEFSDPGSGNRQNRWVVIDPSGTVLHQLPFGKPEEDFISELHLIDEGSFYMGGRFTTDQGFQSMLRVELETTTRERTAEQNINIRAYPNPATDHLFLQPEEDLGNQPLPYRLIDQQGKVIRQGKFSPGGSNSIDLSGISAGTYRLELYRLKGKRVVSFVKL